MIEYKNAAFYTEFFRSIDGFSLIEEFGTSTDKRDEDLYIGRIEVLDTVHPLIVRVEIPFTFPHNKLVFRTDSISGYPHLIHSGKIHVGDWFCLNTPFAETAEEQLKLEVQRLKDWVARQMREDLPAIIEDPDVRHALAFANAYEWENPDEVKEFSSEATLTFVGDFHDKIGYFKESMGYLNCIKSHDNRYYVLDDTKSTNHKFPYIIVDEAPPSMETLTDFITLAEHYGWDDKVCKHLLPDIGISLVWQISSRQPIGLSINKLSLEEELSALAKAEEELGKDDSYLPSSSSCSYKGKPTKVLPAQKALLMQEIGRLKENAHNPKDNNRQIFGDIDSLSDDELAEQAYRDFYFEEVYPYEWHRFALGFKYEGKLFWCLLYTNRLSKRRDEQYFNLGSACVCLERVTGLQLRHLMPQVITEEMYYGRGAFSASLTSKKIALVGLGAIGSMVATALAKSGIRHIALWDNDKVEPGNICRSSYCMKDIGESKVDAIRNAINSINPYIEKVVCHGHWHEYGANHTEYINGSFYANVNYNTQEKSIKEIKGYDLIIDCTGSNEMLHFLSFAVPETDIISMCITNHANELLCISNRDGNPFELRKAYLSRIEQDTKNFYVEGTGCYSPTFLASNCDIAALVNLALREMNKSYERGQAMPSTIYSYTERGIVADRLLTYRLPGYDIILNIPSETMYDAEEMNDDINGEIGYLLGCYDREGKQIMITHVADPQNAGALLTDAFKTSKGLIDYIGDYTYSGEDPDTYNESSLESLAAKAEDTDINTNNPLLAVRNPDGTVSFFLYINNGLVKFVKHN
jgi:hypothetical protein